MSSVWRDVEAALRVCEAQMRFAAGACGVRERLSELQGEQPLIAAIDVMPAAPDVRALLDPLQDTSLERLAEAARAGGETQQSVAEGRDRRVRDIPRDATRTPMARRFLAGDARATPSSAAAQAARSPAVCANAPARVAALLARHEHLRRLFAEEAVQRTPWSGARNERRIVPFAGHRAVAGESVPRSQSAAALPPLAAMLARLSEVAASEPAQRLEAATDRALAAVERAARDPSLASLPFPSPPVRHIAVSLEGGAMEADPALPPAVLRLADLAGRSLVEDTQRADAPVSVNPPSEAASASASSAAGEGVLGRMAGALARIEERLAAPTSSAEPRTQWLTEDDDLAERIHDILRRQALRHGIDAP